MRIQQLNGPQQVFAWERGPIRIQSQRFSISQLEERGLMTVPGIRLCWLPEFRQQQCARWSDFLDNNPATAGL